MHKKIIKIIYTINTIIIGFLTGFLMLQNIYPIGNINSENLFASVSNGVLIEKNIKEIIPEKKDPREENELANPTCPQPKEEYLDMFLLNIGQKIGLSEANYIPNDLRELAIISSTREGICLRKEARDAFELMTFNAEKEGLGIKAFSGFRSYESQKNIFINGKKNNKDVTKAIAKAGHSEHQLGTTVDLSGASIKYATTSTSFDKTKESIWLSQNAYKYGFVMSYPKSKEEITGYMYEPWHYRYIGIENAQKIKDSGQTITEFLSSL
jgi:D-alanyl-D-alanine carboxypeptidase